MRALLHRDEAIVPEPEPFESHPESEQPAEEEPTARKRRPYSRRRETAPEE